MLCSALRLSARNLGCQKEGGREGGKEREEGNGVRVRFVSKAAPCVDTGWVCYVGRVVFEGFSFSTMGMMRSTFIEYIARPRLMLRSLHHHLRHRLRHDQAGASARDMVGHAATFLNKIQHGRLGSHRIGAQIRIHTRERALNRYSGQTHYRGTQGLISLSLRDARPKYNKLGRETEKRINNADLERDS